jgi:hypothetical protein
MQDLHQIGTRHCYACIQWDGTRTVDRTAKMIRADIGSEGRCLVKHTSVRGTHTCELYFPLK